MDFQIRKARLEDYGALCQLFDQIDELHRSSLPHIFRKPAGPPREREYFQGLLEDPDIRFLLADSEFGPVGFVHGALRETPSFELLVPARFVVVDSIVVHHRFQGQGIGRKLMTAVEEWAAQAGADYMELNVFEFNTAAKAFYKNLNYETLSSKMRKSL